jgi:hypothetical protein
MENEKTYTYRSELSTWIVIASMFFVFFNQFIGFIQTKSRYKQDENRSIQKKPHFNISKLDKFPPEMDAYLNDNLYFRPWLLDCYHELKYTYGISPNTEKVIIGADNWLFLGMKDQLYFEGSPSFSSTEIDTLNKIWEQRFSILEQRKIIHHWFIVPIKQHVYLDKMPFNMRFSSENQTLKLVQKMKPIQNKVSYLLEPLKQAKKQYPVFYKLDNHWNSAGGYIAYLEMMRSIRTQNPTIKHLDFSELQVKQETRNTGILSNFVGLDGYFSETFSQISPKSNTSHEVGKYGFLAPDHFPYKDRYERRFVNPTAKNKQKIMIVGDSFGEATEAFFKESFSECLFVFDGWEYKLHDEMMDTFKPDIVIYMTIEPFVHHILVHPTEMH